MIEMYEPKNMTYKQNPSSNEKYNESHDQLGRKQMNGLIIVQSVIQ